MPIIHSVREIKSQSLESYFRSFWLNRGSSSLGSDNSFKHSPFSLPYLRGWSYSLGTSMLSCEIWHTKLRHRLFCTKIHDCCQQVLSVKCKTFLNRTEFIIRCAENLSTCCRVLLPTQCHFINKYSNYWWLHYTI